jgi:hypothetical protein
LIAAVANRAAAAPAASPPSPGGGPGMEMLTIFLRHDQAKTFIERAAWGAYRTEFYPTYDYRALYKQEQSKNP